MKRGFLYGETAPERPLLTTKDPITIPDLHATIFTAMGISPADRLRRRETPVLRHPGRQGPARESVCSREGSGVSFEIDNLKEPVASMAAGEGP